MESLHNITHTYFINLHRFQPNKSLLIFSCVCVCEREREREKYASSCLQLCTRVLTPSMLFVAGYNSPLVIISLEDVCICILLLLACKLELCCQMSMRPLVRHCQEVSTRFRGLKGSVKSRAKRGFY